MGEDPKHPKERREIPTRKLPSKKPSGKMIKIVPRGYAVEKTQGETTTGPPPQQVEPPKGGFDDVVGPKHWIKIGEPAHPPPKKPKPKWQVAIGVIGTVLAFSVIGLSIYNLINLSQGNGGGGGGGGGGVGFDGTYSATVTTTTPIGTTTTYGTFTVTNGSVSTGNFSGTVDADGDFTGTTIISPGSPAMAMTGRFSLTGNFTLSGALGNSSQSMLVHKIS